MQLHASEPQVEAPLGLFECRSPESRVDPEEGQESPVGGSRFAQDAVVVLRVAAGLLAGHEDGAGMARLIELFDQAFRCADRPVGIVVAGVRVRVPYLRPGRERPGCRVVPAVNQIHPAQGTAPSVAEAYP